VKYSDYIKKFIENDEENVIQHIPNAEAEKFLLENAPRLYCPDPVIEETFAFRTFTMRKHIKKTEDGFVLTEFLVNEQLPWAGKHNTINAPLSHHLNEFRWLKNADDLLDYIDFFLSGKGEAFAYHAPALAAMVDFCRVTANEDFLIARADALEAYYKHWEQTHKTENGLFFSNDDREGTEFSISGTTADMQRLYGLRPLMNACMFADAKALSSVFSLSGDSEKSRLYADKAAAIKKNMDEKMWDGEIYKAISPLDGNLDRPLCVRDIPEECNARELVGLIPWAFSMPDAGKEGVFRLLFDPRVFAAKTGLATADISHPRFGFYSEHPCTWSGNVWPYATSYAVNAVIALLSDYEQSVLDERDLYSLIRTYADMHYSVENGKRINFIDEVMLPFEPIWYVRMLAHQEGREISGGKNRGKDYNHSTFIDLVLRGLLGVDTKGNALRIEPRIRGIWKYFKLENLTYRKKSYTVYYDEDGSVFGKGKGVIIEESK
jgi:hypothetical protein